MAIRIRSSSELHRYVAKTTIGCVSVALLVDVANQLVFFESWTVAIRSWIITVLLVSVIAIPVSRAIAKAYLALHRSSIIDPLTGLLTRRALMDGFEALPTALALIVVDVDHFKRINDTHGHLVGDRVLRNVAGLMRSMLSDLGSIGRLGGEEFALLAPSISADDLTRRVEDFRRAVERTPLLAEGAAVRLTLSAGVAVRTDAEPFERLYQRADKALYRAKGLGRNRVVLATEDRSQDTDAQPSERALLVVS